MVTVPRLGPGRLVIPLKVVMVPPLVPQQIPDRLLVPQQVATVPQQIPDQELVPPKAVVVPQLVPRQVLALMAVVVQPESLLLPAVLLRVFHLKVCWHPFTQCLTTVLVARLRTHLDECGRKCAGCHYGTKEGMSICFSPSITFT